MVITKFNPTINMDSLGVGLLQQTKNIIFMYVAETLLLFIMTLTCVCTYVLNSLETCLKEDYEKKLVSYCLLCHQLVYILCL